VGPVVVDHIELNVGIFWAMCHLARISRDRIIQHWSCLLIDEFLSPATCNSSARPQRGALPVNNWGDLGLRDDVLSYLRLSSRLTLGHDFGQEPGAAFSLVDPVLDQAGGSDVIVLIAEFV